MQLSQEVKEFSSRAKGIISAMDVTLQKIEKQLIITTFCHYLSKQQQPQTFMTCSSKMRTALENEEDENLRILTSNLKIHPSTVSAALPMLLPSTSNQSNGIEIGSEERYHCLGKFKNPHLLNPAVAWFDLFSEDAYSDPGYEWLMRIKYMLDQAVMSKDFKQDASNLKHHSFMYTSTVSTRPSQNKSAIMDEIFDYVKNLMPSPLFSSMHEISERLLGGSGLVTLIHLWRNFMAACARLLGNEDEGIDAAMDAHNLNTQYEKLLLVHNELEEQLQDMLEEQRKNREFYSETIEQLQLQVSNVNQEESLKLRESIKLKIMDHKFHERNSDKEFQSVVSNLVNFNRTLNATITFVKQSTKSLRGRRHYLEASLDSLIREYDSTMQKFQERIDELSVDEASYAKHIDSLQLKFKDVEEKYDEMRAMRRLKELLANMEKAEAIKQNWAARKIQVAWRKYKVAKLRKKKLKGRRKKKKTPPPGKAGSPGKASTSDSRSRSKSQTP